MKYQENRQEEEQIDDRTDGPVCQSELGEIHAGNVTCETTKIQIAYDPIHLPPLKEDETEKPA